jgi:phage protein D
VIDPQALISARPSFRVEGQSRPNLGEALLAAQIRLPLAGMASAEVRLLNWGNAGDAAQPDFQFQALGLGNRLEIGFGDDTVFDGRITAIEERYGEGAPQIVLLAEDALQRLARRRESRAFEDMSLDDVVNQVAQGAGLQADVSVSSLSGTWYQHNESDLAFLLRLLIPHDVSPRLQQGSLRARDEEADREPIAVDSGRNADRVRIIADLNRQPLQVVARGYNLAADSEADSQSDSLSPAPQGETAAGVAGELGWEGESMLPHPFPRSQAEAEALAARGFRARAKRFLQGEIVCRGEARLSSGREIELSGVSPRLTGRYRVVDCQHRFDAATGFSTRIKVQRPDWNTP